MLHARANADYDNIIWNTWFTSHSEESVVATPQGNHVIVAIHGGGIYASPERFEKMYCATLDHRNTHGYTGQFAGKISAQEARDVLEGRLPDGTLRLRREMIRRTCVIWTSKFERTYRCHDQRRVVIQSAVNQHISLDSHK